MTLNKFSENDDCLLTRVVAERDKYAAAIRKHMNMRGDSRCHLDDGELYSVLPEGDTRPERETAVTIENCQRYIECRQQGREYTSPQDRIEELEAEIVRLQGMVTALSDRVAAQSEVIAANAARR
jgi:hypothetical protein